MNLFYHLNDRTYGQKTSFPSRQCGIDDNIDVDIQNGSLKKYCSNFESLIYGNKSVVGRLAMSHKLKKHTGCVNTVSWSACGRYLLTGSDDTHVCIWDWENNGILKASFGTGHTSNIFCAKFLPFTNNSRIITCARDGIINVFDLEQSMQLKERHRQYKCHKDSVKKLIPFDDNPHLFLSCSNDGTVRLFDLREASTTGTILVSNKKLQFNSIDKSGHLFCIGASDPIVRVYDIRNLPQENSVNFDSLAYASFCPKPLLPLTESRASIFSRGHITGVAFRCSEILATYSGDGIYLFDINNSKKFVKKSVNQNLDHGGSPNLVNLENMVGERDIYGETEEENEDENEVKETKQEKNGQDMEVEEDTFVMQYTGHCNMRTVKGVFFFGPHQQYVMSGSDDGNIFIWEKKTGNLVNLIKGDKHVVNVLSGHPFDPILATGGIDNSAKIFSPILSQMNPLDNADATKQDNLERLESGPTRPMAIPMALLRRLFQSVHAGGPFVIDSDDSEDEHQERGNGGDDGADNDTNGDNDDSDDDVVWGGTTGERPDGCPMQ